MSLLSFRFVDESGKSDDVAFEAGGIGENAVKPPYVRIEQLYTEILGEIVTDGLSTVCRSPQQQKVKDLVEMLINRISVSANEVSNKINENRERELAEIDRKYDRLISDANFKFSPGLIKYLIIAPMVFLFIFLLIASSPNVVEVKWGGVLTLAVLLDVIPLGVYCLFIMPEAINNSDSRKNALISEKSKMIDSIERKYK